MQNLGTKLPAFETTRLVLRPWVPSDAPELYRHASDPAVGPIAGWLPHSDVDDSLLIIQTVFAKAETYAIVLKETGLPIGSVGLLQGARGTFPLPDGELEIGYWIARPYWGHGYATEAVVPVIGHAFNDLGCRVLHGICDVANIKSKRVLEKNGFLHWRTVAGVRDEVVGVTRDYCCMRLMP